MDEDRASQCPYCHCDETWKNHRNGDQSFRDALARLRICGSNHSCRACCHQKDWRSYETGWSHSHCGTHFARNPSICKFNPVFYMHASFGEMREGLWSSSCVLFLIYILSSPMQEENAYFYRIPNPLGSLRNISLKVQP